MGKKVDVWDEEKELLDRKKMREFQEEHFVSIIRWAYENTVFYRRKFDEAGIKPSDIRSLDDSVKIPFTTKDELRKSQEEAPPYGLHCARPSDIYRTFWSSGTTGRPTFVGFTQEECKLWDNINARSFWSAGLRPKDIFHHATRLDSFVGGYTCLAAAQQMGCNIIPAGPGNTERQIFLINTVKPTFIKILPSFALHVAEVALKTGVDFSTSSIKSIYLSAEPSPDAMRRNIEKKWGATTFDNYGCSDLGQPSAFECEFKMGMHDIPDWQYTEIVDPETKKIINEIGKEGGLVYTSLIRRGMPLIRFWTNDLGSWHSFDVCECGRTAPRINRVMKRLDSKLKIKGVNFWPEVVLDVISRYEELSGDYRIVVSNPKGKDHLKVLVECKGKTPDSILGGLQRELKEKLNSAAFIKVDELVLVPFQSLETTDHKAKRVEDLRTYTK